MRLAGILWENTEYGHGVKNVVLFQGCGRPCKCCHSHNVMDYQGGHHRFLGDVVKELSESKNDVIIAGGEPFDQYEDLLELCTQLTKLGKKVWVYTHHTVDPTKKCYQRLARGVDVLVDGMGRHINLPLSVLLGEIIELEDKDESC